MPENHDIEKNATEKIDAEKLSAKKLSADKIDADKLAADKPGADKTDTDKKNAAQFEKMTRTPILSLLISLSIPTILSMMITNVYNMADTAFVGRLGTSASGAVGIVFGFMAILQAVGFMFGQGCGSIMSRKLGAKDIPAASQMASTGFFGALFLSAIIAFICYLRLDRIVYLLGSTETIAVYAKVYISYILLAAPFLVTSFTMNNILRYEGKAALGTCGMMTGALLNIIGDPIFMFGFKMGIAGAGLSTALSQIVSFCILLSMFLRKKTQTTLSLRLASFRPQVLGNIMLTGFPSLLRQGLGSFATVLLNYVASAYGDSAIAGMSIVSRVSFFLLSFALGIGQGFQPISSYNYGAGKYDRVKKAYRITLILAEALISVITVIALIFSKDIIQIFRDDPEVIAVGTRALQLQIVAQVFMPLCMVTEMLMQSTGKRINAIILSATRSGIFFIPALLILSRLRGLSGIQEAQPLAYLLSVFPAIILARSFFMEHR